MNCSTSSMGFISGLITSFLNARFLFGRRFFPDMDINHEINEGFIILGSLEQQKERLLALSYPVNDPAIKAI
jgi:hypothetical protein